MKGRFAAVMFFCLTPALAVADHHEAAPAAGAVTPSKAVSTIKAASGSKVSGTLHFAKSGKGVSITGEISGLEPGARGFHIHEKGDCTAVDASSAGPHFNPHGGNHGGPHGANRHAGDLGNVTANAKGVAKVDLKTDSLALSGDNSVIGKSVVVHAQADDLKSDPAGNSGARIGCGVVDASN